MTAPIGTLLALDPGPEQTGWVLWDAEARVVRDCGVSNNGWVIDALVGTQRRMAERQMAIEMVQSFGMAVGREVFETVRWIGRFQQASRDPEAVRLIYRKDVKLHLCGSPRAKDANIRQALIDKLGPVGTKKAPGPLFGVKTHIWPALAVAITATEVGV